MAVGMGPRGTNKVAAWQWYRCLLDTGRSSIKGGLLHYMQRVHGVKAHGIPAVHSAAARRAGVFSLPVSALAGAYRVLV